MKKKLNSAWALLLLSLFILTPSNVKGQSEKAFSKKFLTVLPEGPVNKSLQKYSMTAIYTNLDLYGKFKGKVKVEGIYTRGLPGDSSMWNNVYVSSSNNFPDPFPQGNKQEFMENFRYIPTFHMMEEKSFKAFPSTPDNIYARNLIWDMMSVDIFAWNYYDSLKINQPFIIPDIKGEFNMAEIGNYSHNKISLCWKGITEYNGQLCAIVDFTALDNKLELNMAILKTKGTEQYWGTILISLKNKDIEHAELYSGTIQEIQVSGMKDKFLMKTIREIEIKKIL
jgi:hypothetical protein